MTSIGTTMAAMSFLVLLEESSDLPETVSPSSSRNKRIKFINNHKEFNYLGKTNVTHNCLFASCLQYNSTCDILQYKSVELNSTSLSRPVVQSLIGANPGLKFNTVFCVCISTCLFT